MVGAIGRRLARTPRNRQAGYCSGNLSDPTHVPPQVDFVMRNRSIASTQLAFAILCLLCCNLGGCRETAKIERYRVQKTTKPTAVKSDTSSDRMLVAMMRQSGRVWFFKAVGPSVRIESLRPTFETFLKSVQIQKLPEAKPTWKLPAGWVQKAGTGMRFATLDTDSSADPVTIIVSSLRQTSDDWDQYLLSNLNRWRRQLGLGPIRPEALTDAIQVLQSKEQKIWLADIASHGERKMPASSTTLTEPAKPHPTSPSKQQGFDASQLAGKPPEHWEPGPVKGMRKANFSFDHDGRLVQITVIPAGGKMLANVNRWRGQIQLPPVSEADLDKSLQPIEADGLTGNYIGLFGPQEAILAAVFTKGKTQWFVKLRGNAAVAKDEVAPFKAFAESLEFKGR